MLVSVTRPQLGLALALLLAPTLAAAQVPTRLGTPIERPIGTTPRIPTAAPAPPPAGPPPQNTGWDAQGTFGVIAKVVWAPAANAANYVVTRRFQDDPACCTASSGPITTTSWTDNGLTRKGNYIFTITVNYADGSVGTGQVGVVSEGVRNPVMAAQPAGPGRVKLTWNNAVPGTSGFLVGGPGLGQGKTVTGGMVETGLVPAGTHTWTIASIYSQGLGILSPAAEWSRVTHTVSYGSGRYRLSLERFKAITTTAEDPFRNDGTGDEVFITTQINEYGVNAALVANRLARTPTFGDVWNFPARVQAGTASQKGGIWAGNEYPAAVALVSQLQPPTVANLPYLLWEGELTEITGLVILSPAIWESDLDDRLVPVFETFQTAAAGNVPYRNEFQGYVPWTLPGRAVLDTWRPVRSCPLPASGEAATKFYPPPNFGRDEPVDVNQDHSYCPTYVAINWKVANSLTTTNPAAVVEVPFTGPSGWQYKLYLRVEKVSP